MIYEKSQICLKHGSQILIGNSWRLFFLTKGHLNIFI